MMVDFSFIVSLYVSDLPNVTISTVRIYILFVQDVSLIFSYLLFTVRFRLAQKSKYNLLRYYYLSSSSILRITI